jgi:hypothetical protein
MGPLFLNLARKQVKITNHLCKIFNGCCFCFLLGLTFCIITGCAPVLVPAKVIHALNLNIDDFNGGRQPRFSNDFSVDYGELIGFLIRLNLW